MGRGASEETQMAANFVRCGQPNKELMLKVSSIPPALPMTQAEAEAVKTELKERFGTWIDMSDTKDIQKTLEIAEDALHDNRFDFKLDRSQRAELHQILEHVRSINERLDSLHGKETKAKAETRTGRVREWIADQFDEFNDHAPHRHEIWNMTWGESVVAVKKLCDDHRRGKISGPAYIKGTTKEVGKAAARTFTGMWRLTAPVRHLNVGVAIIGLSAATAAKTASTAGSTPVGITLSAAMVIGLGAAFGRHFSRQRSARKAHLQSEQTPNEQTVE